MEKRKMVYVNQAGEVPAQHTLSNGWVYLHNQAALGLDADDNKVKDPSSSGVMDNEALSTVVENYTSCHEKDTQIASLRDYLHKMQDYVDKVKDAVDKANKSPYKPLFK